MTREEAIAILQEEIDGNLELSLREWQERDEQKLFPAIRMAIEALSAEAAQGEWIDADNEPYCECSACGAYIDNLDDDYAFCPRCGTKIKGGDEE